MFKGIYIGPPGTGKTHTLRLSAGENASTFGGFAVVACSYTKAGAHVLSDRSFPLPAKNMGTLHHFAYVAIGSPPVAMDKVGEWNKEHPQLRLSVKKQDRGILDPMGDSPGQTQGDLLLGKFDIYRAKRTERAQWNPDPALTEFVTKWEAWKKENELVDYTDMLEIALRDTQAMPGDPACIILDEGQDCSRLQMDLILHWAGSVEKLVVGADPAQAIFTFAGAAPECIEEVPWDGTKPLDKSYRLPRDIHEFAEKWLTRWHPTKFKLDRHYAPRQEQGKVTRSAGRWTRPEPLLPLIEERIGKGKEVMILASAGFLLNPMLRILRDRGIPFHNTYRSKQAAWNPLKLGSEKRHTALDRLNALTRAGTWTNHDLYLWGGPLRAKGHFADLGKKWIESLKDNHGASIYSELIEHLDPEFCKEFLDALFGATDELGGWKEVTSLWLGAMLPRPRMSCAYPVNVLNKRGAEALTAKPLVTIGTIHSVKGGECDTVIVYPDMSPAAHRECTQHRNPGPMARTMYVGITRAREELVLCSPADNRAVSWSV